MRVLLVEDEPGVSEFVRQGLTEAGYAVDVAYDGVEGLDYALAAKYDVMVFDVMMPKMDGMSLLRQIRKQGIKSPVLLLTARIATSDRVKGLDAGADDYLIKPFAFAELLARIRALLRRPSLQLSTTLKIGDLQMSLVNHEVRRASEVIELSPREFSLLEYLMRNPDQVLTRTQIAHHVWNFDFIGDMNVVGVYIGYLRRKIDNGQAYPLIHTVRGVGYRLSVAGR